MSTEIAQLLALCASAHYRAEWLKLDTDEQARRCRQLDSYNVLSVPALASIFEVSTARIEQILGYKISRRGQLNPKHISILAYALSNHDVLPGTLRSMVESGTSLNMISALIRISPRTLTRRMRED